MSKKPPTMLERFEEQDQRRRKAIEEIQRIAQHRKSQEEDSQDNGAGIDYVGLIVVWACLMIIIAWTLAEVIRWATS